MSQRNYPSGAAKRKKAHEKQQKVQQLQKISSLFVKKYEQLNTDNTDVDLSRLKL